MIRIVFSENINENINYESFICSFDEFRTEN